MSQQVRVRSGAWILIQQKILLGMSPLAYARSLATPFNLFAALILLAGLPFIVVRFAQGLSAITSGSDVQPFGLLLGIGLFCGVPLAATGYVILSLVYIFGLRQFRPVVSTSIVLGLVGYTGAVIFLLIDLGRPWRLPYPMLVSWGTTSVLLLVAWDFALYLSTQLAEFGPSTLDWLGLKNLHKWAMRFTVALTIFGVTLSTLHQSSLGAIFLLMPEKVHPLWYTSYLPWLFFVSSIAAGLSMVIVVSALNKRFFRHRADAGYMASIDGIILGLGKGAAFVLFVYFGMKLIGIALEDGWGYLNTSYGYWYLTEILGFVLLPMLFFAYSARIKNVRLVILAAFLTAVGVVLNRLNVSLITFNWQLAERELFHWKELLVGVTIITAEVLLYRWILNRLPILRTEAEHQELEEEDRGETAL